MSHPLSRRFLTEGFVVDYTKPSVDLTTEPDFMAFYKFHLEVCALWNTIIDEVMKNDCVDPANPCPGREAYIAKLEADYNANNPPQCFLKCNKVWDAKSSLEVLSEAVPDNINCYRGTLTYVLNKSNEIIKQVNDAMAKIPPQGFADYKAEILCSPDKKGPTKCKDAKGDIYIVQPPNKANSAEAAKKQLDETNKIIGRCRVMTTAIPTINKLMVAAKHNVEQLKIVQQKAKSGQLLPEPAKKPPT
jgi:hypothetical protein